MHLFISAGEPSGDLHGANLVRALRKLSPDLQVSGFGGELMREAGVEQLYPLTELAVMWIGRTLVNLDKFFRLARQAEVFFRTQRPDAVILIDYPGFHWALAKRAHRAGIPVYYFVPPQLWAWAGWRVDKVRRWVNTVLTALPFEEKWYSERGVKTHYVGHPYFDELHEQKVDIDFVRELKRPGGRLVAILPGSRNQEVTSNFPLMLAAAARLRQEFPDLRFPIASYNERQAKVARELAAAAGIEVEIHVKKTPEIIEAADACISVSGSVGFELMYRLKPTVVVYKIAPMARFISRQFITCKYISLVNLVADEELFPEFLTTVDCSESIAAKVASWMRDPVAHFKLHEKLSTLKESAAIPGACDRAAHFLLDEIRMKANAPENRSCRIGRTSP